MINDSTEYIFLLALRTVHVYSSSLPTNNRFYNYQIQPLPPRKNLFRQNFLRHLCDKKHTFRPEPQIREWSYQQDKSNSVKRKVADWCCYLANNKQTIMQALAMGSNMC